MVSVKKATKKKLFPLGNILSKSFKNLGIDTKFAQQQIMDQWDDIAGEKIGSVSAPEYFKFRTLFVKVSDPAWLQQLVFLEDKIKDKINKCINKKLVQKIYFKVGEFSEKRTKKPEEKENNPVNFLDFTDLKDEKEVEVALKNINNHELKMVLKRILMKGSGVDKTRCERKKT